MKRRYELICRDGFDSLLASNYSHLEREWAEPATDPPDWYLTIGGRRFAVEATSITEHLNVGRQDPLPSPAVMTSLAAFVDEIEEVATKQGILSGAYLVSLAPFPNLREHKQELLSRFLDYIEATKDVPSAPEHSLGYIDNNRVSIVKMHSQSKYVAEMISGGVKTGNEAQEELKAYLADAIAKKNRKLSGIDGDHLLLILDAYHYSHLADWRSAVEEIPEKEGFQAIARVTAPSKADIVWPLAEWLVPK